MSVYDPKTLELGKQIADYLTLSTQLQSVQETYSDYIQETGRLMDVDLSVKESLLSEKLAELEAQLEPHLDEIDWEFLEEHESLLLLGERIHNFMVARSVTGQRQSAVTPLLNEAGVEDVRDTLRVALTDTEKFTDALGRDLLLYVKDLDADTLERHPAYRAFMRVEAREAFSDDEDNAWFRSV